MQSFRSPVLVLSLVFVAVACPKRKDDGDGLLADEAADSLESSSYEGSLITIAVDPASSVMAQGPLGDAMAAAAAANAGKYLLPPGCVTATAQASTTTYVYNDCTGPYGLVHVTGTATVTFDPQMDGLHVHLSANGLKINGATFDIDTNAVGTQNGSAKSITVSTKKSGTGPRGGQFDHTGNYTFAWDTVTKCHTLDGTWTTVGRLGGGSTTVTGYKRCSGACPASGTVTYTGSGGRSITITYDGSANAQWSVSGGRSGTVMLFCTAG